MDNQTEREPEGTSPNRRQESEKKRGINLFGLIWKVFTVSIQVLGIVLIARIGFLLLGAGGNQLEEKHHSLATRGPNKIAIISLEGAIITPEGFVKQQIDQVRKDPAVKGIVLRVNSPGGSVTAADYMLHHLQELVKDRDLPVVVSMGGIAASGGYYVSMVVGDTPDSIFAEPTTWTGSIGVIIPHYNLVGLMEKLQIEDDSIMSHPIKKMGTPTRRITDEEKKIFEGLVSDAFERFKQIIRGGRPAFAKDPAALDKLATGQVFTTPQAIQVGLVDREGFIEDAIDRVLVLAKLDSATTQVIQYSRPGSLFDFSLFAKAKPAGSLENLFELATPRAYYLSTWLPAALTSTAEEP